MHRLRGAGENSCAFRSASRGRSRIPVFACRPRARSADRIHKDVHLNLPFHSRFALCTLLDVYQHPLVNQVDDGIGPETPVGGRPEMMWIPGCAFQECLSARQFGKTELTAMSDQEAVEVGRMDLGQGVPLAHRSRVAGHGELEQARLVPDLDRLDERTRRELATAERSIVPSSRRRSVRCTFIVDLRLNLSGPIGSDSSPPDKPRTGCDRVSSPGVKPHSLVRLTAAGCQD